MIFAISQGTEGYGPERYVAYLPFVLAPGVKLAPIEEPVTSTKGPFNLTLEKLHNLYALSSGPFTSEEAAALHINCLRGCLLWLSLRYGAGVDYPKDFGTPKLFTTPIPITESSPIWHIAEATGWSDTDGAYNADVALIRPEHKRLTRWETGRGSVEISISIEDFFHSLGQTLALERLPEVIKNDKLKLAIELYAAYRFELSDNAQLLTLVSSLESLLAKQEIPKCSNDALTKARAAVKACRDNYETESTEWSQIDRLLCNVGNLKTESIGATLRTQVLSVVSRNPELGDPDNIRTQLGKAYNLRSKLLHEGHPGDLDVEGNLSFLREFVPRLLKVLFREAAEGAGTR